MIIYNGDDDENQPSIRCKVRNAAAWEHLKESIVSSPRILLLHPILPHHHHDQHHHREDHNHHYEHHHHTKIHCELPAHTVTSPHLTKSSS